ncbi:hypothetical protein [Streptomyces sp. NBC_01751]|uniref:hypothetical protein n=1 Tax=Streptomyces sp. NBC_01751 TaxID=2975929 RepID=UPI002DD7B14D|nr:hypothetical protein [Streptomyces sp. NBC_01751]WSD28967.1 DUF6292 family protein [Streptomyces sp. NBC_01751]
MAVVAALEAAGACIADFDLYTDEDRRMYVTLAAGPDDVPDDEDDTRRWILAWIDDRGWFTFLAPGPGESLGSCVSELPCSLMELPEDVAAAVAADRTLVPAPRTDRPLPGMEETGRGWRPPAAYVTDPEVAGEPGQVCLDLERALAAYCQHPAWLTGREQQLAASPARPARAGGALSSLLGPLPRAPTSAWCRPSTASASCAPGCVSGDVPSPTGALRRRSVLHGELGTTVAWSCHTGCSLAPPVGEAAYLSASVERLHRARRNETAPPLGEAVSGFPVSESDRHVEDVDVGVRG